VSGEQEIERPLEGFFQRIRQEHDEAMAEREALADAEAEKEARRQEQEEYRRLIAQVERDRDRVGPDIVRRTKLPGGDL